MAELARQRLVRGRFAEAAHHRGDLGIEQRIGDQVALMEEDFDVLPRGVQHLHDPGD